MAARSAGLLVLIFLGVVSSAPTHSAFLDSAENYLVEWSFNHNEIIFELTVNTTGWFGLGFSPNGGMPGSDIITAWIKDGQTYIQDRHATRNGLPQQDIQQDVTLISGSESDGQTRISFSRKLNTCDDKDMDIGTDTMRLIWAMSADGQDPTGSDPTYHQSNRGSKSFYLRRILPAVQTPKDAIIYDMTVKDVAIPTAPTTYHCELMKPPTLKIKHHLIKVEPLIQKENLGIVHHIILYGCYDKINRDHFFHNRDTSHRCYSHNMPNDIKKCRAPVTIWAVGGGAVDYPPEAGFPIGEGHSPDYYLMEVHYDNPQRLLGRKDNSGIRLTLTKQLRQYDSGVIQAGSIDGIAVPPGVKDFRHDGYCSGQCSSKFIPASGIKIFGSYLHGHLSTRKVIARHFRSGKELSPLDADYHYDFNYQQYKLLATPRSMLPGDDIMMTCHYDTEDRKSMTYGGLPSTDEMCLAFLYYYPKQEISSCMTVPGWLRSYADYSARVFKKSQPSGIFSWLRPKVSTMDDMVKNKEWTDELVMRHSAANTRYPQSIKCDRPDNSKIVQRGSTYKPPETSIPEATKPRAAKCSVDTAIGK